jgi:hypothetical protein
MANFSNIAIDIQSLLFTENLKVAENEILHMVDEAVTEVSEGLVISSEVTISNYMDVSEIRDAIRGICVHKALSLIPMDEFKPSNIFDYL